jgi:hypothetical protein
MLNVAASELSYMVARGLSGITAAGFLTTLTEGLVEDVHQHIQSPRLRVAVSDDGINNLEPVAFIASEVKHQGFGQFGSQNLYHLGGIIIDEKHRGVGEKLLRDELKQTHAGLLGFHTQNARMLSLGDKLAEHDFHSADMQSGVMGTPIARKQYRDLPERGLSVIESARYGHSSLYGNLATFYKKDMAIPGLNPETGDAIVYVGKVKK